MKKFLVMLMVVAMASFLFVGCLPGVTPEPEPEPVPVPVVTGAIIDIAAIPGVTAPVADAIPDLTVTATAQYTGVTTWSPTVVGTFAAGTVYTATITLTPKTGYTLTGVLANFFTVAGAASDTNPADSGVVTAVYVVTPAVAIIDLGGILAQIAGVTAPVAGVAPDLTVTATAQYTGVTTWSPAVVGTFAQGTVYTATITLTPTAGYTLTGVLANFFVVAGIGAGTDTNPANSGVVTAIFPATAIIPTVVTRTTTGDRDGVIDNLETLILTFSVPMTPTAVATVANITAVLVPFPVARIWGPATTAVWNGTNTVLTVTARDALTTMTIADTITITGFTSAATVPVALAPVVFTIAVTDF